MFNLQRRSYRQQYCWRSRQQRQCNIIHTFLRRHGRKRIRGAVETSACLTDIIIISVYLYIYIYIYIYIVAIFHWIISCTVCDRTCGSVLDFDGESRRSVDRHSTAASKWQQYCLFSAASATSSRWWWYLISTVTTTTSFGLYRSSHFTMNDTTSAYRSGF